MVVLPFQQVQALRVLLYPLLVLVLVLVQFRVAECWVRFLWARQALWVLVLQQRERVVRLLAQRQWQVQLLAVLWVRLQVRPVQLLACHFHHGVFPVVDAV